MAGSKKLVKVKKQKCISTQGLDFPTKNCEGDRSIPEQPANLQQISVRKEAKKNPQENQKENQENKEKVNPGCIFV